MSPRALKSRNWFPASLIAFLLVLAGGRVSALAQGQPDIRSKIKSSGLSADQIRAKLQATGFSPALLDQYLKEPSAGAPEGQPSEEAVRAIAALVPATPSPQGTEPVRADAGGQPPAAPTAAKADDGLQVFGIEIFRGQTSQFQPMLAGPVPSSYRVGPGDVMVLVLTGDVEVVRELSVTREGFLLIPQVGQMFVTGLTLDQLRTTLADRLGRSYSGITKGTTRFEVSVARMRTNQVFVIGEVAVPGAYQLASVATALNALYAAGGPQENGSFRAIEIRRGGKVVSTLDLYDYLLRGDTKSDPVLEGGDIVFVPLHGRQVSVDGPVSRSAIFELRESETLVDLMGFAGGFTARAARDRLLIRRIVPPTQRTANGHDRVVLDVPLGRPGASTVVPAFRIEDGDRVEAFSIASRERGEIVVSGNVWNGGPQGLRPGMKVSDALRAAGGARSDFLPEMLIARALPDGRSVQIHTELLDTTGRVTPDFALQEDDSIRVFAASDLRSKRGVDIRGAVREGGQFGYREGMTLRDAVLLARGFRDSTVMLPEILLWRLQPDLTRQALRLPLWDSSGTAVSRMPLVDGDSVMLFSQMDFRPDRFVRVSGEVLRDTRIQWHDGVTLRDIVQLAGGLTEGASLQQAEIARLPKTRQDGRLADTLHVPLDSTYLFERGEDGKYLGPPGIAAPASKAPEVKLEPYDHVLILRQPGFALPQTVTVLGQVLYPGVYTLRSREDRLADVIDRAGGLSPQAYPGGLQFTRNKFGRIGIDLTRAMRSRRSRDNVVLADGDSIEVPAYQPVVQVTGAVNSPISVPYVAGRGMRYYVSRSGGKTHNADLDRSYVRQPNGGVESYNRHWWILPDREPEPRPGAVVVIGVVDPNAKKDWAEIAGSVAQVLGTIVAIVAIATRN